MAVNPTSTEPTVASRGRSTPPPSPRFPRSPTTSAPSTPGLPALPRLPPTPPASPAQQMLPPQLDLRRHTAQHVMPPASASTSAPPVSQPPVHSGPAPAQPQPPPPPIEQPPPTVQPPPSQTAPPPTPVPQIQVPQPHKSAERATPPARRVRGRPNRPGRPPNINENSLMRRLECVMAVESGRMSMLTACQQYDISARTFYRWLRNKDRLIELTGFTEDDFKDTSQPQLEQPQDEERPPQSQPQQDDQVETPNLPRLSMPATSAAHDSTRQNKSFPPPTSHPATYVGSKRRFPKNTDPAQRPPFVDEPYPPQHTSPSLYATRRRFTKMPSQITMPRDAEAATADRQAARSATRMRRPDWSMEADMDPTFRPDDRRHSQQFRDSRSNSPSEQFKRRKLTRPGHATSDDDVDPVRAPQRADAADSPNQDADLYNGAPPAAAISRPRTTRDNSRSKDAPEMLNGSRAVEPDPTPAHESSRSSSGKHRLEIIMGRRTVVIAWYEGASSEDIKASIARRFALLPGTQWALMDKGFEEVIISAGVPSGRYTLTVFT